MDDITKDDLRDIVFVAAHNAGELSADVASLIAEFDEQTYRRLLEIQLEEREKADESGNAGGGTHSATFLREALEHLDFILRR